MKVILHIFQKNNPSAPCSLTLAFFCQLLTHTHTHTQFENLNGENHLFMKCTSYIQDDLQNSLNLFAISSNMQKQQATVTFKAWTLISQEIDNTVVHILSLISQTLLLYTLSFTIPHRNYSAGQHNGPLINLFINLEMCG